LGAWVAGIATVYDYLSDASGQAQAARFTALNLDPNDLGLTLVLGLPIAWSLCLSQPYRRPSWTWGLYIPLGITAVLLTASRGAFVAGLVALMVIPWTLAHVGIAKKIALYALAVGSLVGASSIVPAASLERVASTRTDIASGYFGGRGVIWESGLLLVREHPLAGVGAGAFAAAAEPTIGRRRSSHAAFLSILVEEGIVGLLLFLTMAVAALNPVWRLPALERKFSLILFVTLAVGSLSLALDYRKQLWLVLGLLAAQVTQRSGRRSAVGGLPAVGLPEEAALLVTSDGRR
jgi:O-antigen ligase